MSTGPDDQPGPDNRSALHRYAACLRSIIENVAAGILLMGPDGIFTYANASAEHILELSRREIVGTSFQDPRWQIADANGHPLPTDDHPIQCAIRENAPVCERIITLTRPDGVRMTLSVNVAPMLTEASEDEGFVVSFTDITTSNEAARILRESEERFRMIVETFPGFIWITEAMPPYRPIFMSNRFEEMYGYAREDFMRGTLGIEDILLPEFIPRLHEAVATAIETRRPNPFEFAFRRSDGSVRWILGIGAALVDDQGAVQSIIGTAVDITSQKTTEHELKQLSTELDARVQQRTAELENEHRRLRAVLDALPVGVVLLDANSAFQEMNAYFRRIWGGIAPDDVPMVKDFDDIHHFCGWWAESQRQILPEEWAAVRALHQGETNIAEVIDILRFDGTCGTILNSAAPIRGTANQIVGAVVVIQDITEERVRERKAHENAAMLFAMFDQVPVAMALFDDHLVCRQINATYANYAGSAVSDLIGHHLNDLLEIHFDSTIARVILTRFHYILKTGRLYTASDVQMHLRTRPGETIYVDWSLRRIYPANGMPSGVLVTVTDVTAHTRARQQIEFERARWLTSLMAIPLGVLFITTDQIIQVANAPAEAFWGAGLFGSDWHQVIAGVPMFSPTTLTRLHTEEHPISRAMRGEAVQNFEAIIESPRGRVPVLVSAMPVQLDDEIVGVVQVVQDLTRLKEADQIKDEFLATVTHDLRSPLTAIQGWAEFALETDDLDLIQEGLHAILRSIQVQRALVEDLLDASALQAGSLRLQPEIQDIRSAIADVLASFEPIARERGLQLVGELPEEPAMTYADAVRIQQIAGNLVSNAIKFTPAGGGVTVRLTHRNTHLELTVHDTGIGIAPEVLPHIFERFYRATERTGKTQSLGLGLSIVKALVDLHGGSVTAQSPGSDQGTTFTVVLPGSD